MSPQPRIGATKGKNKPFKCDWKPDGNHEHKGLKKPFPKRKDGNTKREDLGNWTRPHALFEDASPSKRIRYTAYWGRIETKAYYYPAQRHHVIPVQSMAKVAHLGPNLELLGYNINTEANGMRLPMFDQDIFWHDLPRHCGWNAAHSAYNVKVANTLKDKYKTWKTYCRKNKEKEILDELNEYIQTLRDKIIQWIPAYYVFEKGGDRSGSFDNAGVVAKDPDRTRKFPALSQ